MQVHSLGNSGALMVEPQAFGDERGWFFEVWNDERYRAIGVTEDFKQLSVSKSQIGVLRGLHFQEPHAQGKLVTCISGEVYDVAVDIRVGSPTFGQWWATLLNDKNHKQLWIPPGFAHGFETRSESAVFAYLCTETYRPDCDRSVRWDDPTLKIDWQTSEPQLSAKDASAPFLKDIDESLLPRYHR